MPQLYHSYSSSERLYCSRHEKVTNEFMNSKIDVLFMSFCVPLVYASSQNKINSLWAALTQYFDIHLLL